MASLKWQAVGKVRGGLPLLLTLLSLAVVLTAGSALAAAQGSWDLGEGNAVIRDTPYATVYNMVVSGFNGGYWNGPGIYSSKAAAPENFGVTALGTVLNDIDGVAIWSSGAAIGPEFNIPALASMTTTDIVIKYTFFGDANLDGVVNSLDQTLLDFGFGSSGGWFFGDFNYDGIVDSLDQTLLDFTFDSSGLSVSGPASPVPEPSIVAMVGALAIFGFGWLRR